VALKMSDLVIVKAKIKEQVGDANVASDFVQALDAEVKVLIKKAVKRAEDNNRKTVMAKDL
jgi:histone H3/H4